ncbi:catalase family protein [Salinisphaera sp. SPP-AMP-43]|uniref:catalase family protein n=1 Tax=Salinisphaera sp. SPP-AMP-43 TaxID=3121288 RepID=UPI003C6E0090
MRYSDDLEREQPDEQAKIRDIVDYLRVAHERAIAAGQHAPRDTHAKGQGFVKGTLTVDADLPEELAQSLFAAPGDYPAVLRFATEPGAFVDDRVPAARGLAMKVLGVGGEKMADDRATQDFLFNNCPILPLAEVTTYREIAYLRAEYGHDPQALAEQIAKRDDAHVQTLFERLPNIDLLAHSYYSQSAFRYGDYVCKYALMPYDEDQRALAARTVTDDDSQNALSEWLAEFLSQHEARFDFCVQLMTDPAAMPIEDASVEWDVGKSAWRRVAHLHLPRQDPFTPARRDFSEDVLSFDPWAGRADLRPLGSINRVRKSAYRASSTRRHEANGRAEFEPASSADIPD